ncbi:uncharacterized protein LOC143296741 [Babylonia areolata]|uniref:uncharacterized protein LOC143296741 n=1 Tax=Babylonia areolata TaxID=304850 RepID=UPI003FD6177C
MEQTALKVCVWGATESHVTLMLHALAGGQLFGHTQPVTVMLHAMAETASEVVEEALDLCDACYPLLTGVEVKTDVTRTLSESDVVLLVLETSPPGHWLPDVVKYADALNTTPRTRQKAVIVVGRQALAAVSLLCVLAPQLSPHLVTALHLPSLLLQQAKEGRGGHLLTKMISDHVSCWWSALLDGARTDMACQGLVTVPLAMLPSLSTTTTLNQHRTAALNQHRAAALNQHRTAALNQHRTAALNRHIAWFTRAEAIQELEAALKCLHISQAQVITSALSCHL